MGLATLCVLVLTLLAACTISISQGQANPPAVGTGSPLTVHIKVVTDAGGSTLVLLPVTIGDSGPYDFALDTGASTSLIDMPIARKLDLDVVGPSQPVTGIGSETQATPIRVDHWHVATLTLPASTVLAADLGGAQRGPDLQGLVGSDIWRRFGSVTIDYSAQTLTVGHQVTQASGSALRGVALAAPDAAERPRARAA
jgi:hypothetical protein